VVAEPGWLFDTVIDDKSLMQSVQAQLPLDQFEPHTGRLPVQSHYLVVPQYTSIQYSSAGSRSTCAQTLSAEMGASMQAR